MFEAYLAHLRSRGARLAVRVEAADELPTATVEWLERQVRRAAGALRLVGRVEHALAPARAATRPEPRAAAPPTEAGSTALTLRARTRTGWPARAAAAAAALGAALLWSRAGEEAAPPRDVEPARVVEVAPHDERPVVADAGPTDWEVVEPSDVLPPSESVAAPAPPASTSPLDAALAALEAGDAVAYRRALRRVEGPAARRAEAELVLRLDEHRDEDRERRMLAAWGLAVVGGGDALPTLDTAADDADRHVAGLAARSAAVIRARLAAGESASGVR